MPLPLPFYLRTSQTTALTHGELDGNLSILSTKIDNTTCGNVGTGIGIFRDKQVNPNDGTMNLYSLSGTNGVTIGISGDSIVIASTGGGSGTDYYTTGLTFNQGTYDLTVNVNDGNDYTVGLGILSGDMTITGGTYNPSNGVGTFTNNSGGTFDVTGFLTGYTDIYTTGVTLNGNTIEFDRTDTSNAYSVDLYPILSGFSGTNAYWTSGSTGDYSIKTVNISTVDATGDYAVAEGEDNQAAGNNSHAGGFGVTANGQTSFIYSHNVNGGGPPTGYVSGAWSSILGGTNHIIDAASSGSSITGGYTNVINNTADAHILGHTYAIISGSSFESSRGSAIIGGKCTSKMVGSCHKIYESGGAVLLGGSRSVVLNSDYSGALLSANSSITNPYISSGMISQFNTIVGGYTNILGGTSACSIVGGIYNEVDYGYINTIIGGTGNTITSGISSSIVGGIDNALYPNLTNPVVNNSVILGGSGLIGRSDNTVYVPYLNINNAPGGTSIASLGITSGGLVITGDTSGSGFDWCDANVMSGNTETCCIEQLWVTTLSGCSPIHIGGSNRIQGTNGNVNVDGVLNLKNNLNPDEVPYKNDRTSHILVWNQGLNDGDLTKGDVEYVPKKALFSQVRESLSPFEDAGPIKIGTASGSTGVEVVIGPDENIRLRGTTASTEIFTSGVVTANALVVSATTISSSGITTNTITTNVISATTLYLGGVSLSGCCEMNSYYSGGTPGGVLTWDLSGQSTNFEVTLVSGTSQLDLTNVINGEYGTIIVHQDTTGSRTLALGNINGSAATHYVVNGGGGAVTLTTTASATDILSFTYNGTAAFWTVGNDYT